MKNMNVQPIIMNGVTVGHYNAGPKTNPWTNNASVLRQRYPTSDVDLLAVSAYLYRRYRDDSVNRFSDLIQTAKYSVIEIEDHQRAEDIVRYYSEQITMAQLRGDKITDFQRAVTAFITSDRRTVQSEDGNGSGAGLIYRLPEYHENDLKMRAMFDEHFNYHRYIELIGTMDTRLLQPLMSIDHLTRVEKATQYWLKDIETGNPMMLAVDSKNQLKYLWEDVFNRLEPVAIKGNFFINRTHPVGVNFTHTRNWKLMTS